MKISLVVLYILSWDNRTTPVKVAELPTMEMCEQVMKYAKENQKGAWVDFTCVPYVVPE